jgi:DNA-binding SARP family transcriptional activator
MGLTIRLLGRPAVIGEDGAMRTVRGHQSWAVLARVLLSDRPVERRRLAAELFPDTQDPLGALRWCLAALRRATGAETLQGDPIGADLPAGTTVDVLDLKGGTLDLARVGDLLEGIEPRASAEFETWLLVERERVASLVESRIRQETLAALASGDSARAVRLAELGVRRQPLDEHSHVLLVRSLVVDGRVDAALHHVEATEQAFLAELGEKPSAALRSAARASVAGPPVGVPSTAVITSLIESGIAALAAGAVEAGIDCLRHGAAEAEAIGDIHLRARALSELGTALVHAVRGYDDEGAITLRDAVELARQCGAPQIAAASLRELGYIEAMAGRRPAAAKLLDEGLAASGGDANSLAGIHAIVAFNLVDWGKVDEGIRHHEIALDHARSAGNRRREAWSLGLGGWALVLAERPDDAVAWLEACLSLCEDLRWLAFRPWPAAALAEARLRLQEEPASLRAMLEDEYALSCRLDDPCWEGATSRVIGLTFAAEDDYGNAMLWLARARTGCVRVTDPYAGLLVQILADQVAVSLRQGEADRARAIAREYLSAAARTHADAHLTRAMALVSG